MSKDPAFLFYPGDYLRDTQTLSENTQVSYDRIMCEHMRNICISKQQLKFFTKRLTEDEIEELKMVLTEVDGGYCIDWVVESINKRKAYSESRRKNREPKKDKDMKDISKTYVPHMENENENIIVIIDYLNLKTGRNFSKKTDKTKKQINARLKEGFTVEDFKKVINNRCVKWLSDPKMNEYLRPETLFGTKFESYLNVVSGHKTRHVF